MRGNLPAFNKPGLSPRKAWAAFLFFSGAVLCAQTADASGEARWYRSNSAGLALEEVSSSFAALRNDHALVIFPGGTGDLPAEIREYGVESFSLETRILYGKGKELRRQWLWRDQGNTLRVLAVYVSGEDETRTPVFIERYDERGLISQARQFTADGEIVSTYFYRDTILVRSETGMKAGGEQALYTDRYWYNRSGSLRKAERSYHDGTAPVSFLFRRGFPGAGESLIGPSSFYSSPLADAGYTLEGYKVVYTADERGRVLSEVWEDQEGAVFGRVDNTWSGDRLASYVWTTADGKEERRTEFEYDDSGDRIAERNYNDGILERTVIREGDHEIEGLYMNGVLVLRAIWKDGRKTEEERVR
jgi:hypothetical protein